jgi:transposase
LTIDPGTKTFITTSEEGEVKQLDFNDMYKKLDKLMKIEQVRRS